MTSTASLMPLSELMSANISPDDLDFELDPDSKNTMNEFEVAWRKFMKDHPELVPEGKREKNIRSLQELVKDMRTTHMEASEELHKQLDFFEKSKETMEQGFEKELNEARSKQRVTLENLQRQCDSIAIAEHLLSEAIPCEKFLSSLDKVAEKAKNESSGSGVTSTQEIIDAENDKKAKPSTRAMFLVDDKKGDSRDVLLRACRIDHALLNTEVKMLQKEAEGYVKLLETQGTIGKFLNEYSSSSRSVGTK